MAIEQVVLPITGTELKEKLNEIINEFLSTVTDYGGDGRIRFDDVTKHFYFEVKQPDDSWLVKAEIGKSIIVDAMRLIKGDKPTDISPNEIAYYNKEVELPDGTKTLRPHFVLPNGYEYGMIVINEQTGDIEFRDSSNGALIHVPYIYVDKDGNQFKDIRELKFTGDVIVSKNSNNVLEVSVSPQAASIINDDATGFDTTYSSNKIVQSIPDGAKIVADIDAELGSTDWKTGGTSSDTAIETRNKLETLTLNDRLAASSVKDIASQIDSELSNSNWRTDTTNSASEIKTKLETLTGDSRLDVSAVKNVPDNTTVVESNTDEINRLKTLINDQPTDVFTLRGSDSAVLPQDKKAYYVSMYGLVDDTKMLTLPDGNIEGTIVSIHNEDIANYLEYKAGIGETLDGSILALKLNPQELIFLVKQGTNWVTAFKGLLPNDLGTLIDDIKSNLPIGTALTIAEIQAALKDRLHTFREIQTEFANQLHTITDLVGLGFERAYYTYGFLDENTVPIGTTWRVGEGLFRSEGFLNIPNQGDKYVAFIVSEIDAPLISDLFINDVKTEFTVSNYLINLLNYKILITNNKVSTDSNIKVRFNFGIEQSSSKGITLNDGTTNVGSVETINLGGATITNFGSNSADVDFGTALKVNEFNDVNTLTYEVPLQVNQSIDEQGNNVPNAVNISLDHSQFEKRSVEGFYACLSEEIEIIGKNTSIPDLHTGDVWLDDIIVPNKTFIALDRAKKAYGIEEDDFLDPNVTGGSDVLIYGRIPMKGIAANDGLVKVELVDRDSKVVWSDTNNQPISFEKQYKKDDELGFIDFFGIVKVKGQTFFNIQVSHSFTDDNLVLEDRTEGNTCLMIQYLDKTAKTSEALLQLENDLNINIEFTSHYMGDYLATIDYIKTKLGGLTLLPIRTGLTGADGWGLSNTTPMKAGFVDNHILLEDDNNNVCHYNFHKIFSAEKTRLLRGKTLTITTTLIDKAYSFNVYLAKWTGKADAYTTDILTAVDTTAPNWTLQESDKIFIPADAVQGDHTVTGDMTVPNDAENFAIFIAPNQAEQPSVLSLKDLRVDVKEPFTGYILNTSVINDQEHLKYSKQYKEFIQDNQGFAGLRYTINDVAGEGQPMPCGILGKGLAEITLDDTVNQVVGSSANGGEGAIRAQALGTAIINTQLRISSEQAADINTEVKFWWARVLFRTGAYHYDKIADSEGTFAIKGSSKNIAVNMPEFSIPLANGNRIALRASADKADGAYIESIEPSKPMVFTKVIFEEFTPSDDTGIVKYEDLDTNDFTVGEDNKVTITEMQNIQDRLDEIDMELVVTDNAKAAGWYIELDTSADNIPSLRAMQRTSTLN